jgi:hypothetical protein
MRTVLRLAGRVVLVLAVLVFAGGGVLAVDVLLRAPLTPVVSTTDALMGRRSCLECHAPITEEWQQSYHNKSVTGPYWEDVRQLGYLAVFNTLRKPCLSCHAPANVLDLSTASAPITGTDRLGVECTPNLLRNPAGVVPLLRIDDVAMGVDCTACHVSRQGIVGSGRHPTSVHRVTADARFQSEAVASDRLCRTCHRSTVEAWKKTALAEKGTTCLDCHMPLVNSPAVAGGPERPRRSHRFMADKDDSMLRKAVKASLDITADRRARVRIRNDGAGHYLPSGGNALSVVLELSDASGRKVRDQMEVFARDEALLLDFWPFNRDNRIQFGEEKTILVPLPDGRGRIDATVRYHDWMKVVTNLLKLSRAY